MLDIPDIPYPEIPWHKEFARGDQYGVLHLRLAAGQPLRTASALLSALNRSYAESAWLHAAVEEAVFVSDLNSQRRDNIPEAWRATAKCFLEQSSERHFSTEDRVAGTSSEAIMLAARTGSWIVDILGKLNPLAALESFLVLGRDWSTERQRRRLQNSELRGKVLAQQMATRAAEFRLLRQMASFLRESGCSEVFVRSFAQRHLAAIAAPIEEVLAGVQEVSLGAEFRVDEEGLMGRSLTPEGPLFAEPPEVDEYFKRLASTRRVWEVSREGRD